MTQTVPLLYSDSANAQMPLVRAYTVLPHCPNPAPDIRQNSSITISLIIGKQQVYVDDVYDRLGIVPAAKFQSRSL